jgi:uroporphyrinogen-III synthase
MNAKPPLTGLNIVVTRPYEQAAYLSQRLAQAGGNAILFPLLEIGPAADPQTLNALILRLSEFDLAIFISPNAVRYGMTAINAAGAFPASLRVATVGQGSARALRDLGMQEIIAPQDRYDSEALLALPALQSVGGWRIVIFRGDGGRDLLGDTLKARGASVEYAECYRRNKPQQKTSALLVAKPDAITITSSEALGYLWDMSDSSEREKLASLPLFVPHARIAEAAQRLGWRTVTVTPGGDDGMLSGLIAWASHRVAD